MSRETISRTDEITIMLCLFTDPKKTYNKQITKKTLAPVFPDHILNFSMNICIVLICQNALAENSSC